MKKCSYCGAKYSDDVVVCAVDETPLCKPPDAQPEADTVEEILVPPVGVLAGLDMGFSIVEGFSRPDWKAIHQFVSGYYAYISYFHSEGTHILSSGVFLRGGYAHIALPYIETGDAQRTLVHELCHNLLCHLRMPLWLNEGIAVAVQNQISGRALVVDREIADRQRNHWNETNIQSFWSGKSYRVPGDDSELSCRLGHILVHLLSEGNRDFISFVKNADWRDAGQDAAQSILDKDLGEVLGGFLGPGNWRPQRKAIAEQQNTKSAD
jgi:hypothetical protein